MHTQRKQQGVVLVIGLLMLLLITILGVSAMSSTSSNERTAGNNQFSTISFQAAESAIKNLFSREDVFPTIMDTDDLVNDKIITDVNTFNVNIDKNSAATIVVQARSIAEFCGGDKVQMGTSLSSGTGIGDGPGQILAFDVTGDSQVGGTGAQEDHLRSGMTLGPNLGLYFNGPNTSGACLDP